MTRRAPLSVLLLAWTCSNAALVHAQEPPPLWIQSVTVDAAAGTATITGTGFSETCAVTLDGHALTVLPGGTAARLVVVVPATLLTTPGTYRLTVTDAGRQTGDAFELTIADRPEVGLTAGERGGAGAPETPGVAGVRAPRFVAPGEVVGTRLVEDAAKANAAFGTNALANNTTGTNNTAGGAHALQQNTGGFANTAVGNAALFNNLNGDYNTALGFSAGRYTVGNHNILIGSNVEGTAESNTLRVGVPFNPAPSPDTGINRTFVAGIRGTTVNGATPVGVNADGQLGMANVLGAGAGYGCDTCYQAGTIELYNPGTGDLNIQSGPSYRTMLNPNGGNVGVGVTALFGAGAGFGCASCYQAGYVQFYNPATGQLTLQSGSAFDTLLNPYGGNVGIGVGDAVYPLQMASGAHVTAGGVWTNASSRALKENITPLTLEHAQEALLDLAPVEYTYKADPSQHHVGFIAEDVPTLVAQNDRASLSPMDLVAVLTKVAQDQQARIARLEGLVQAERAEVQSLQQALADLVGRRSVNRRER